VVFFLFCVKEQKIGVADAGGAKKASALMAAKEKRSKQPLFLFWTIDKEGGIYSAPLLLLESSSFNLSTRWTPRKKRFVEEEEEEEEEEGRWGSMQVRLFFLSFRFEMLRFFLAGYGWRRLLYQS